MTSKWLSCSKLCEFLGLCNLSQTLSILIPFLSHSFISLSYFGSLSFLLHLLLFASCLPQADNPPACCREHLQTSSTVESVAQRAPVYPPASFPLVVFSSCPWWPLGQRAPRHSPAEDTRVGFSSLPHAVSPDVQLLSLCPQPSFQPYKCPPPAAVTPGQTLSAFLTRRRRGEGLARLLHVVCRNFSPRGVEVMHNRCRSFGKWHERLKITLTAAHRQQWLALLECLLCVGHRACGTCLLADYDSQRVGVYCHNLQSPVERAAVQRSWVIYSGPHRPHRRGGARRGGAFCPVWRWCAPFVTGRPASCYQWARPFLGGDI